MWWTSSELTWSIGMVSLAISSQIMISHSIIVWWPNYERSSSSSNISHPCIMHQPTVLLRLSTRRFAICWKGSRALKEGLAWKDWRSFMGILNNIQDSHASHSVFISIWCRSSLAFRATNSITSNRYPRKAHKWRKCTIKTWRVGSTWWKEIGSSTTSWMLPSAAFASIQQESPTSIFPSRGPSACNAKTY